MINFLLAVACVCPPAPQPSWRSVDFALVEAACKTNAQFAKKRAKALEKLQKEIDSVLREIK